MVDEDTDDMGEEDEEDDGRSEDFIEDVADTEDTDDTDDSVETDGVIAANPSEDSFVSLSTAASTFSKDGE